MSPRLAYALLAVLYVALLLCVAGRWAGAFWDEGFYLMLARAMSLGQGFHATSLPDQPLATGVHFLYPFLLSLAMRLSSSWMVWKSVNVLAAGFVVYFTCELAHDVMPPTWAALCGLVVAFAPQVSLYSSILHPEEWRLVLSTAALLIWCRWRGIVAVSATFFCLGVATLVHASSLLLLMVVGTYELMAGTPRQRWALAGTAAVLMAAGWLAHHEEVRLPLDSYIHVAGRSYDDPVAYLQQLPGHIHYGLSSLLQLLCGWFVPGVLTQPVALLAVLSLAGYGAAGWEPGRRSRVAAWLIGYFMLACLCPWLQLRYLMPLLPPAVVLLVSGCRRCFTTLSMRWRGLLVICLAAWATLFCNAASQALLQVHADVSLSDIRANDFFSCCDYMRHVVRPAQGVVAQPFAMVGFLVSCRYCVPYYLQERYPAEFALADWVLLDGDAASNPDLPQQRAVLASQPAWQPCFACGTWRLYGRSVMKEL